MKEHTEGEWGEEWGWGIDRPNIVIQNEHHKYVLIFSTEYSDDKYRKLAQHIVHMHNNWDEVVEGLRTNSKVLKDIYMKAGIEHLNDTDTEKMLNAIQYSDNLLKKLEQ